MLDDYIKYDTYYGPDGNRLIGDIKIVNVNESKMYADKEDKDECETES